MSRTMRWMMMMKLMRMMKMAEMRETLLIMRLTRIVIRAATIMITHVIEMRRCAYEYCQ